ncbi:MAG TPA: nucleotidyltransferase family protein [Gemmatimonadales bacterium]
MTLLRACVREDEAALRAALTSPATDVAGCLAFAHEHRLAGFVWARVERLGLTGLLPPAQLAAAAAGALFERARSERLTAELRRLGELLQADGVPVLFLKGPLLARRFYGGLDARAAADLDLFIRSPDLARVEALLGAAGYAPAFRVLLSRRLSRYFTHHFEYRRDGLPLDVHWAFQRHFSFAIDYRRVWTTTERAELGGRVYEVLSPEYELVLQLLGIQTDLQVGKLALRSAVDVYHILRAMEGAIDWGEFCARRGRERILRPSAYVLAMVLELLHCREEFPALAAALEPALSELPSTSPGVRAALDSRTRSPGQKLLALRLYETPLAAALSWWLVSLPFRLAVYGVGRGQDPA